MVNEKKYNWKRYFIKRGEQLPLTQEGFLQDISFLDIYNIGKNLKSTEEIQEFHSLIILGEPGIGKSTILKEMYSKLGEKNKLLVDLNGISEKSELKEELFESSSFKDFLVSDYKLHIFLDSFDECLLEIKTLVNFVKKQLDKLDSALSNKIFFRIACRTFDWEKQCQSLEEKIENFFGSVDVFELAPLRVKDVNEAASSKGLNSAKFIEEVYQKEVGAFASKPVTFEFLIESFSEDQKLPKSKVEIYEVGCERLCEVLNESRIETNRGMSFPISERVENAKFLAFIFIFSNKDSVYLGNLMKENKFLKLSDLEGRKVYGVETKSDLLRETLDTGLFTGRGNQRIGFAHKSYAEFLASKFLIEKKLPIEQILNLLINNSQVVPQLEEVASWLASMSKEFARKLLEIEPELLLRGDSIQLEDSLKEKLVLELMKKLDKGLLPFFFRDYIQFFDKLNHRNLSKQIAKLLPKPVKFTKAKKFLINLIEYCELSEFKQELLEIALTKDDKSRVEAVHALTFVGDKKTNLNLKSILNENNEDDYERLRGCTFEAIWKFKSIPINEILEIITPRKRDNYFGSYAHFLSYSLIEYSDLKDLKIALNWALCLLVKRNTMANSNSQYCQINFIQDNEWLKKIFNESDVDYFHKFSSLIDKIILKSWKEIENDSEIFEKFSLLIFYKLKYEYGKMLNIDLHHKFENEWKNNDSKRRSVLKRVIELFKEKKGDIYDISHLRFLCEENDIEYFINWIGNERSECIQKYLAELIRNFHTQIYDFSSLLLDLCWKKEILKKTLSRNIEAWEIESESAKSVKEGFIRNKKNELILSNKLSEIEIGLTRCEKDNSFWWKFSQDLIGRGFDLDLTRLTISNGNVFGRNQINVWESIQKNEKKRFLEIAKKYLLEQSANNDNWFGKDVIHLPALAGLRSLILLLNESKNTLNKFDKLIWEKWILFILFFVKYSSYEETKLINELIEIAYSKSPNVVINAFESLLNKSKDSSKLIRAFSKLRNQEVLNILIDKLNEENELSETKEVILEELLKQNDLQAQEFVKKQISKTISNEEIHREKQLRIMNLAYIFLDKEIWVRVWEVLNNEVEFGKKLIHKIASDYRHQSSNLFEILTTEQLGKLYSFLLTNFPKEKDLIIDGSPVGSRFEVERFRDSILDYICKIGTKKSYNEVLRIKEEFPQYEWLKYQVEEARKEFLKNSWLPKNPDDLIRFISDKNLRFVENSEQLLSVVISSLKKFEEKLQGDNSLINNLWNEFKFPNPAKRVEKKKVKQVVRFSPKDENHLSDNLVSHLVDNLELNGIVVNREVEIRKGEKVDIFVVAKPNDEKNFDSLSLIIEVKGCWHDEVKTAMRTQLLNRYLKDNKIDCGIYLVGCFSCEKWDSEDLKSGKPVSKWSLEKSKVFFEKQANDLSTEEKPIKAFVLNTALRVKNKK
ncbi:MAG: hypothetical protein DWQ06_07325 [Calditrichaeota bacterium]|nr:MAG: hypothetical protein DWQ06_07325 [Calditrichota bacterium]